MRSTADQQQVKRLVAANQTLRCQIQEKLDWKCLREWKQLDGHLRTVFLLQQQISESVSAQGEKKLQLLTVQLTVATYRSRFHKERERRGHLEAELSVLRQQEEELRHQKLPELRRLLDDQTRHQGALQTQHRQDIQGLLAQVSGGVVQVSGGVAVQASHLTQHLDRLYSQVQVDQQVELRSRGLILQEEEELRSRALILEEEEEELRSSALILQEEEEELMSRALILEAELQRQQSLNVLLEERHVEKTEYYDRQLVALQQRAERELQASAQQAEEHQVLLDVKNTLETEIRGYKKLLDGFLSQPLKSKPAMRSFPDTSRKVSLDRGVTDQGRNFWTMKVQTVSKGQVCTVKQTPALIVLLETVTTKRFCSVHDQEPQNSPVIDSIHDPGTLRTGAAAERTSTESILTSLDEGAVIRSSETAAVANTAPGGETEIKQASYLILQTTTELMTATAQTHHLNGLDRDDPAIITSVNLETSESVRDEESIWSEEDQGDVNLKLHGQEKTEEDLRAEEDGALRLSQNLELSGLSNSKTKSTETSSNCRKVTNSPEIQMFESEGSGSVTSSHDTNQVQVDLFSSAETQTHSAEGLSYCDFEELLNPTTTTTTTTTAGLSPEMCPIPVEEELIKSDEVFCQTDLKEDLKNPNDSDLSTMKELLSSNSDEEDEEDEEANLSLTEANANVTPVEKYILSTKEEKKFLSRMNESSTGSKEPVTLDRSSGASDVLMKPPEPGRSSSRAAEQGLLHGESHGCESRVSLSSRGSNEISSLKTVVPTSQTRAEEFGSRGSGEWKSYGFKSSSSSSSSSSSVVRGLASAENPSVGLQPATRGGEGLVYDSSLKDIRSPNVDIEERPSVTSNLATSPPEKGRFGSGEWRVYGGRVPHMSSPARSFSFSFSLPDAQSESTSLPSSPPHPRGEGRFGSTGSGEWRVYGGNAACLTFTDSVDDNHKQALTLLSRRGPDAVVRRSRSVSSDRKHDHSSGGGRSPGGGTSVSGGSGGWLNSATAGGNRISSARSQGSDGSRAGGRIRSISGSGRTNHSTGGRVISSSDRPIRSTGSGTGGNKERISVCKMAALKISEAGRERSQERRKQQQQQHKAAASSSPLVQRWLTSGVVGVTSVCPDDLDDIMHL